MFNKSLVFLHYPSQYFHKLVLNFHAGWIEAALFDDWNVSWMDSTNVRQSQRRGSRGVWN